MTKHISPYSGQTPSSIWAAFSELCIHLEMLSYENKFCNFHTSEKEEHHKDDSSKKTKLFGLKTLFLIWFFFLTLYKDMSGKEKYWRIKECLKKVWTLTAFIFHFADLSVIWIFSEVHGTSNVVIVPGKNIKGEK